ncbi:hypothetical protein STANM309S_06232 [Streptomyces tanashiensis]
MMGSGTRQQILDQGTPRGRTSDGGTGWETRGREAVPGSQLTEQLRLLRRRNGMTLATLAHRTSYSKSSWGRYLSGKALPPRQAVREFAQAVWVKPDRLLLLLEIAERGQSQPDGKAPGDAVAEVSPSAGQMRSGMRIPIPRPIRWRQKYRPRRRSRPRLTPLPSHAGGPGAGASSSGQPPEPGWPPDCSRACSSVPRRARRSQHTEAVPRSAPGSNAGTRTPRAWSATSGCGPPRRRRSTGIPPRTALQPSLRSRVGQDHRGPGRGHGTGSRGSTTTRQHARSPTTGTPTHRWSKPPTRGRPGLRGHQGRGQGGLHRARRRLAAARSGHRRAEAVESRRLPGAGQTAGGGASVHRRSDAGGRGRPARSGGAHLAPRDGV